MSLKSSSTGAAAPALGLRPRLAPVGFRSASGAVVLAGLLAAALVAWASATLASG